jgi:hypothetical protein
MIWLMAQGIASSIATYRFSSYTDASCRHRLGRRAFIQLTVRFHGKNYLEA